MVKVTKVKGTNRFIDALDFNESSKIREKYRVKK
jgi:hypothetical protein